MDSLQFFNEADLWSVRLTMVQDPLWEPLLVKQIMNSTCYYIVAYNCKLMYSRDVSAVKNHNKQASTVNTFYIKEQYATLDKYTVKKSELLKELQ